MKCVIGNKNISLKISQCVLDEMYSKAMASFPNETGGMLAGHISEDNHEASVECIVTPSKTECSHASFLRETDGMEQTWKELAEKGLIYLGEWHTHIPMVLRYIATQTIRQWLVSLTTEMYLCQLHYCLSCL